MEECAIPREVPEEWRGTNVVLSQEWKKKIPIIHHYSINIWKVVRGGKKLLVDNAMITESNTVDIIHFYFGKPFISLHMIFSLTSSYSIIDIIQQYGGAKTDY